MGGVDYLTSARDSAFSKRRNRLVSCGGLDWEGGKERPVLMHATAAYLTQTILHSVFCPQPESPVWSSEENTAHSFAFLGQAAEGSDCSLYFVQMHRVPFDTLPKTPSACDPDQIALRSDVSFFLWHVASDGLARAHFRWLQNRGRAALSTSSSAVYLRRKRRTCKEKQGLPTFGRVECSLPSTLGESRILPQARSCHVQPTKFCSAYTVLCCAGFFHDCRPSVENVEDVDLPGPWGWRGPQANRSDHATISNLKQDPILGMSQWTFPLGLSARHRYYQWTLDNGQWLRPTRLPPTPRNRRQITTTQTLAWPQRDMSACVRLRRPWHRWQRWHRCNRHKPGFHPSSSQPTIRGGRTAESSSSSSNGDPITHRRTSPCSPRPLRQRTLDRAPLAKFPSKTHRQETWLDRSHTRSIHPVQPAWQRSPAPTPPSR